MQNAFKKFVPICLKSLAAFSFCLVTVPITLVGSISKADVNIPEVEAELQNFRVNPRATYNAPVAKSRVNSTDLTTLAHPTTGARAKVETLIRARSINASSSQWEASDENVDTFINRKSLTATGQKVIHDFPTLYKMHLENASLAAPPWSDSYWPTARGGIANRYAVSHFADLEKWLSLKNFVSVSPHLFSEVYASGNQSRIDDLSPGEKYDLLIGDLSDSPQGYVTTKAWEEGAGYVDKNGEVEDWMGLCHGWAPASYNVPRPVHAVTVLAADGHTPLTFYPSDIKGLVSLAWANGDYKTRLIGDRCPEEKPRKDPRTGRPLNKKCLGVNASDWHIAVLHQLGIGGGGMVIDVARDNEVWNQPIQSYNFVYFNPQTGKAGLDASQALVGRSDFTFDMFAEFRPKNMASVVGVAMEVKYVDETEPSHNITDFENRDKHKKVTYIYDLELDANGKIIGGEWYQGRHPSMIWDTAKLVYPVSRHEDEALGEWQEAQSLPESWTKAAKKDAKRSQVLGTIVERLVDWSIREK